MYFSPRTEEIASDIAADTERVTMNDGELTSQVIMVRNTDFTEYQRDTLIDILNNWKFFIKAVADLSPPSTSQNFHIFTCFFGKFWQNCRLAPPPTRNPGSTPERRREPAVCLHCTP